MRDDAAMWWLLVAITVIFASGFGAGIIAHRVADTYSRPPCHEDEALVWVNAPVMAECVPLDDLPVTPETGER